MANFLLMTANLWREKTGGIVCVIISGTLFHVVHMTACWGPFHFLRYLASVDIIINFRSELQAKHKSRNNRDKLYQQSMAVISHKYLDSANAPICRDFLLIATPEWH